MKSTSKSLSHFLIFSFIVQTCATGLVKADTATVWINDSFLCIKKKKKNNTHPASRRPLFKSQQWCLWQMEMDRMDRHSVFASQLLSSSERTHSGSLSSSVCSCLSIFHLDCAAHYCYVTVYILPHFTICALQKSVPQLFSYIFKMYFSLSPFVFLMINVSLDRLITN